MDANALLLGLIINALHGISHSFWAAAIDYLPLNFSLSVFITLLDDQKRLYYY